jgi:hypothetical protein
MYAEPRFPAALISQVTLGVRVDVLERAGHWLSTRSEDGYLGWIHEGYVLLGDDDWARAWERSQGGEPIVSLGAELVDRQGRSIIRLPWGARLLRRDGVCMLPDGRSGRIAGGEVIAMPHLAERFPPNGDSIVRTARRWLGAPYLWGGVTPCGVDCSGLAQAVLWLHGIALPRDSDLQAVRGSLLAGDDLLRQVRPGDLLFFADHGDRVTHVAIGTGGPGIIHSALGNGGVAENDLEGDLEFERRLRGSLVHGRRLLPD